MNNNQFKIDVVSEIPAEKVPGTIYINGTFYANKIPQEKLISQRHGYYTQPGETDTIQENKRFLLVGKEKLPKNYLGLGADKEVVACVSEDFSIDSRQIILTPNHPGFINPEPAESSRFYFDSVTYTLYQPVETPRINGYKVLKYLKEQSVVYKESATSPNIYVYSDYLDTEEVEGVMVIYDTISTDGDDEESTKLPLNVIVVHSEEELHALTPSFMGVYKVVHPDGTFTPYIYNPYNIVAQEFFNFNCDIFY